MSRFNVNDIAYFNGSNEQAEITAVREGSMATFYQVNQEPVWVPERMLWDGDRTEKMAFCSQLECQKKLELKNMVKGVDYTLDQYGFPMCIEHKHDEQWV